MENDLMKPCIHWSRHTRAGGRSREGINGNKTVHRSKTQSNKEIIQWISMYKKWLDLEMEWKNVNHFEKRNIGK
ncbi:hypothetical protein CEXT_633581 [Caerostris extrusa]|uniref:Uncharacterized protein n=1 Tax=Caerostris extrusa TaxID=172846 RepID=A0AAV4PI28_CAEEX|nr:hypothetical protein CEXT_633581 [Caerostris extrusa]